MAENQPIPQLASLGNCLKFYRVDLKLLLTLISLTNQITSNSPFTGPIWYAEMTIHLPLEGLKERLPKQSLPPVNFCFLKSSTDLKGALRESKDIEGWHYWSLDRQHPQPFLHHLAGHFVMEASDLVTLTHVYFCANLTICFPVICCGPPLYLMSNWARGSRLLAIIEITHVRKVHRSLSLSLLFKHTHWSII